MNDSWTMVRFDEILELQRGHDLPTSTRGNGEVPVIGSFGVTGTHDKARYDGPGVAIGRSGAAIGTATLIDGPFWPLNTCLFVRDFKGNDPRWVYQLLKSTNFAAFNSGSAQPSLNRNFLKDIPVRRPPIHEQHAIAAVLGALDDKIAANDRIARLALELGDSLFSAGRHAGETRTTIGELADQGVLEFGDGYRTKRSEHGQPGLPILRAGDVRDFQIDPNSPDFVSKDYLRQIGTRASRPGDIIMTTKGTVGRVAVVPPSVEQVVYSPQICYFRVSNHERLDAGYLAAWFRSGDLKDQSASLMYKSDMAPYINLRDIRSLAVPLLALSEQRRQGEMQRVLLDRFDTSCVESEALSRTRDEILPLLMSGKVRVKDAEAVVSDVV